MSLRMALLGLLSASGPSSGYDLTKTFATTLNHVWHSTHSQIYPELGRMAEQQLVSVSEQGARGRKTYAITERGREELKRWIVEVEPDRRVRSVEALRAFLLTEVEPEQAVEITRKESEINQQLSAQLRDIRARYSDGDREPFGDFAMEFGIRRYDAVQQWADWARKRLESESAQRVTRSAKNKNRSSSG